MIGDSPRIRLSILGIVAFSLFAALFARLWYLQVIGTEEYQLQAEVQNRREIAIEAPRGRILDARGRVLVDNRISIVVTLDPQTLAALDDPDAALDHLAEVLTEHGHRTKVADLQDRLADPQYNPVEARPVAMDVTEELEVYLLERHDEFPAVDVRREAVRVYPYGNLAAHVLGYVGRINEDEHAARMGTDDEPIDAEKPYERDDSIGKTGVELQYENELRGTPGVQTLQVDARGEPIRTLDYEPPVPGNDIQLTIDIDVQKLTEEALVRGLERARTITPDGDSLAPTAPAGAAVVTDPRTGAVVALASYPTYDPAEFVGGISTERYAELLGDEAAEDPFTNRAISGQYAPGSTFKLITAYAGLTNDLINANTSFNDEGRYTANGCDVQAEECTKQNAQGAALGVVNLATSLSKSSDVFYYWLGDRFWYESGRNRTGIQDAAEGFGLHEPTGLPLPYEQAGWIPTPERNRARWEENQEAFPFGDQWFSGNNMNLAIGQGEVLVTPFQLANAYATFANRGTVHAPNIAARVLKPGGNPASPADVIREFEPRVVRQLDMPPQIWDPMHAGFIGATTTGTATAAFTGWDHNAWWVAGKTGTAQVTGKADYALFAGYTGPVGGESRYAVSVVLEEAGFGGEVAAPVARWILEPLAGLVPLPPALTIEQQEAGPVVDPECIDVEGGNSTTTTTSTTVAGETAEEDECAEEDDEFVFVEPPESGVRD
jgi:penicillin-binding protein 2